MSWTGTLSNPATTGLHIVATPIGTCARSLPGADLIACEHAPRRATWIAIALPPRSHPTHDHSSSRSFRMLQIRLQAGARSRKPDIMSLPSPALTIAGLPTDQFFAGFLPPKNGTPRPHRRTGSHPGDFGVLRNRHRSCRGLAAETGAAAPKSLLRVNFFAEFVVVAALRRVRPERTDVLLREACGFA